MLPVNNVGTLPYSSLQVSNDLKRCRACPSAIVWIFCPLLVSTQSLLELRSTAD